MDFPVPIKKYRPSELLPSESFKSEYIRDFTADMIKALTKGNGFFFCDLCKTDNVIGNNEKDEITQYNKTQ